MTPVPTLPPRASLRYLAEGAANIVYRITIPRSSPSTTANTVGADCQSKPTTKPSSEEEALRYDPVFEGKLLRLRKALPSTVCNEESYRRFQDVIRTLFPAENLVEQVLVHVTPHVITECNRRLRLDEGEGVGTRPRKRRGVYLALNETFGTLITDMSPDVNAGEVLVEFKPKWLVQSPSAPKGARRCRTCALRAKKERQRRGCGEARSLAFCPLDLVSRDRGRVKRAVTAVCSSSLESPLYTQEFRDRLVDFLYENPLVQRLKQLQEKLDRTGILEANVTSRDFLTAMTLRDCTMFLKVGSCMKKLALNVADASHQVPLEKNHVIEARLGDLDLKSSAGEKAVYWRNLEKSLIDEGWYTGTEKEPGVTEIDL
ncbi:MAG: Inositol-pentakisphosphate 2-kinase [Pleopsidium flavum]|nr:MAG: Inositol-pentakisphosphate 2-kinase [Pleopsidium flavum]